MSEHTIAHPTSLHPSTGATVPRVRPSEPSAAVSTSCAGPAAKGCNCGSGCRCGCQSGGPCTCGGHCG